MALALSLSPEHLPLLERVSDGLETREQRSGEVVLQLTFHDLELVLLYIFKRLELEVNLRLYLLALEV